MEKITRPTTRFSLWSMILYGVVLGLLLAALQAARYRLLILDHAQEMYMGLIALLFTVLGIWAGHRLTAGRKEKNGSAMQAPPVPLAGPSLEKALEKLTITPREFEVLQCIAQGLSNQEIAERLFVSLNTVKTHTSNLFAKLGAQRRTQAVQKAQALGLLSGASTTASGTSVHPKV